MKILIFGATGKAGRVVVAEALARGHEVVAFVHKTAPPKQPGLYVATGDIHDAASVIQALKGCNAVISCLSSWGTPKKDVLSSAMRNIIPAMEAANVQRIVTLTGNIALMPGERVGWILRAVHRLLVVGAPRVAKDAEDHLQMLKSSKLTWTGVRSPVMVNGAPVPYRLTATVSLLGTIPRRSLAAAMLDIATSDDWARQALVIRRKQIS